MFPKSSSQYSVDGQFFSLSNNLDLYPHIPEGALMAIAVERLQKSGYLLQR